MNEVDAISCGRASLAAVALGLSVEARPAAAHRDLSAAAQELGMDLERVVKTMVLRSGSAYFIALVPGGYRLSWPKVRAALGVGRVTIASADEATIVTGYPKGGISPLGLGGVERILADSHICGQEIAIRGGVRTHNLVVDADSLILGLSADVFDLCDRSLGG